MIRVVLKGGLGNQMFQYAFGKNLALIKHQNLILDTSFLDCRIPVKNFTIRNYELDLFGIPEKPKPPKLPHGLYIYLGYPVTKIFGKFNPNYLLENNDPYKFDKTLYQKALDAKGDIAIEGYWNNYKYFDKHKNEIKEIFNIDKLYDPKFQNLEHQITKSESVSVNIRRGDYLNAKHKDVFVYLDKRYYTRAIDIIRQKVNNPKFFIFSYDDPDWIKHELEFKPSELVIIGKDAAGERFKTYLRLISLCKHNILSNSTFAFWGAYLKKADGGITVYPTHWGKNTAQFEAPKLWQGVTSDEKI